MTEVDAVYQRTLTLEAFHKSRAKIEGDKFFRKLSKKGLISHVTEMGMTAEQLRGRMVQFGNCTNCFRVGSIYEPCPTCNAPNVPQYLFMPMWTELHCFVNPRFISKMYDNTTVPVSRPEPYRVQAERRSRRREDDPTISGPILGLFREPVDVLIRNRMRARGERRENHLERLLRYIVYGRWEKAYEYYKEHLEEIGDPNELKGITIIDNPANPP